MLRPRLRCVHFLPQITHNLGGLTRAVLDFCQVLAARGHDVTLATFRAEDVPREWELAPKRPRVVVLDRAGWPGNIMRKSAKSQAAEILESADVLHLHAPWLLSNIQFAAAARAMEVPYILTLHGMLDDWSVSQKRAKKRLAMWLYARDLLERAARVHCTAQAELDQARKWFPNGRGVVAPLIFDLEPFGHLPGPELARESFPILKTDRPRLLFLSRVHPKKGVELLIDALRHLAERQIRPVLLIAGPGEPRYIEELKARVASAGLQDSIQFIGSVQGKAKVSLYQACDLLVLPSSQENFGLVLAESMACGTPIMTTKGVDPWEEFAQAGAFIVEQDSQAIAQSLQTALADRSALKQRGQRGRDWTFSALAPDVVASQYETIYQQVCDEASRS